MNSKTRWLSWSLLILALLVAIPASYFSIQGPAELCSLLESWERFQSTGISGLVSAGIGLGLIIAIVSKSRLLISGFGIPLAALFLNVQILGTVFSNLSCSSSS